MAGVKGRSGGPRKNAGGKRPGAGRKPKHKAKRAARVRVVRPELTLSEEAALGARLPPGPDYVTPPPPPAAISKPSDAKLFLEGVLTGAFKATPDEIRAAQALLPFQHQKLGEAGKKDKRQAAAEQAASKFTPRPRLTVVPK
jgi:phage terminase small subunit